MGTSLAFKKNLGSATSPLLNHAGELLHAQFAKQRVSGGFSHQPAVGPDFRITDKLPPLMLEWLKTIHHPETPLESPPPPRLRSINANTGSITFHNGVPVGGWSNLRLFPDGSYSFSGHFHDSGFPSYNDALVWIVRSSGGSAFLFKHTGRLPGTMERGSRDDDWNEVGNNAVVAEGWDDLSAGYNWHWDAGVNMDVGQLIESAKSAVGTIKTIIELA